MRIAVFLERLNDGTGGFQQALSTIESLTCNNATTHEFLIFTQFDETRRQLSEHGIDALLFKHRGYRLIDRWSATVLGFGWVVFIAIKSVIRVRMNFAENRHAQRS